MARVLSLCALSWLCLLISSPTALAQSSCNDSNTLFKNPVSYCNFGDLLIALIDGVVTVLIPIVTLGIVYIGFRMVISGGSKPEEYVKWRTSLVYALLGLFLVLGAKGILSVIENTVGEILRSDESTEVSG